MHLLADLLAMWRLLPSAAVLAPPQMVIKPMNWINQSTPQRPEQEMVDGSIGQ
jgi:hypothetical protein